MMEYKIVNVNGHVEVYNWRGDFQFSADTEQEARNDLREFLEDCA